MTKRKSKPTTPAPRTVFEVTGPDGKRQIDAQSVAELAAQLARIWPLDEYAIKGAASLALNQRATITGRGWAIKRLGAYTFTPDTPDDDQPTQTKKGNSAARQPQPEQPAPGLSQAPTPPAPTAPTMSQNAVTNQPAAPTNPQQTRPQPQPVHPLLNTQPKPRPDQQ